MSAPLLGDDGYPSLLDDALEHGHVTAREAAAVRAVHYRVGDCMADDARRNGDGGARLRERRTWAAIALTGDVTAAEALISGLPVPRQRLDSAMLAAIGEAADGEPLLLDDELALRVEMSEREAAPMTDSASPASEWLESAAELLRGEAPGEVPYLVEQLIVDRAGVILQGAEKTGKTYLLLELGIAMVTGRPALGRFEVAEPGPVILVLEETGRYWLHRRLDRLARGYAIAAADLGELYFSARLGVRLNEPDWQDRLLAAAADVRPRAILFDPFVRVKGSGADENLQREIGPSLEFLLRLQQESGAAVGFSHHTGHEHKDRLRGSSDLEAWWESKLILTAVEDGVRDLRARHRDDEDALPVRYRMDFDSLTSTVRLDVVEDLRARVAACLTEHPDASANDVYKALGGHRSEVLAVVRELRSDLVPATGTTEVPPPSGAPSAGGTERGGDPRRGSPSGTTTGRAGTGSLVPAEPSAEEVDRLEAVYEEMHEQGDER